MSGIPAARHREVGKLPNPPCAWSAMLSSWTLRYSGVSGACWASPQGLVWSWDGCPRFLGPRSAPTYPSNWGTSHRRPLERRSSSARQPAQLHRQSFGPTSVFSEVSNFFFETIRDIRPRLEYLAVNGP